MEREVDLKACPQGQADGQMAVLIAQAKFHYFRSFAQRKPTWLLPVSGEVPRRALGR